MQLTNRIAAVVTGAASGLGRVAAESLAAAGAKVAVFDVNDEGGRSVAAAIGGAYFHVDVTSEREVVDGFSAARAAHGQERICVHCAQVSRFGPTVAFDAASQTYRRFSTEDFAYSAQGIFVASYRVASIAALGMASLEPLDDGERGVIVLTASVAAHEAQIGQIAYGASKAGVNGLALPMARDLMDLGIRVNSVMPGLFDTPSAQGMQRHSPAAYDAVINAIAFPKRPGRPEEFGSFVLELVRNAYFNGQSLRLDGGLRIQPR